MSQSRTLPQLFNGGPTLHNQYGVTSHVTWRGYDYDNYRGNIASIQKGGFNSVRTDFNHSVIGWDTDNVDCSVFDDVYNETRLRGIQLLPIIYYKGYKKYTTEYSNNYKSYINACVSKYKDNAIGWEIWNEMDQMYLRGENVPSPSEYIPLLKDAYLTIKNNNPNNKVLLGAIGDPNKDYFTELLSNKAADYCDILSIHYYSAKNPPESIIPFFEQIDALLNRFDVNRPIWLTETGYNTINDSSDPELFYKKVLPVIYRQLHIDVSHKILGVLYDQRINRGIRNQDNNVIYFGFKSCRLIGLNDLRDLSIEECPVLMVLFGEIFPQGYIDDLKSFVKRGGTVVFPEGGAVLYYDWNLETDEITGVGNKYYKDLHIDYLFSWYEKAKQLKIKKLQSVKSLSTFEPDYTWYDSDFSNPLFLSEDNLVRGDTFIPIMNGTSGSYTGPVAGYYVLNSDMKGNIIIQTRQNLSERVSESLQASRMPRLFLLSYAFGVDKVFSYCLNDKINDGYGIKKADKNYKPAYRTIQTLIKKMPSGSTRPHIQIHNNQFIASWNKPNGDKVFAVWSSWVGQDSEIEVEGDAKYYDDMGKRMCKRKFNVSPNVVYIENATSVFFK